MATTTTRPDALAPFVPRLVLTWLAESPDEIVKELPGSMVFVDVSGFTRMSEQLARKGKIGAEEITDVISSVFARLLAVAYGNSGGLIKFGGDALLLYFDGEGHEPRAARSAVDMRRTLRGIGRVRTSGGSVTLRMSVGVHSGSFHFFLVGDSHRELIVTGPAASRTVLMESTADAGEIVVSRNTAAALPPRTLGSEKGEGVLLRSAPPGLELREAPRPPAVSEETLRYCVPLALRQHLLAGLDEPEHRQVTVAFLGFGGSDQAIMRDGATAFGRSVGELIACVQQAADVHAVTFLGTDIDRDGGKIILTAGAPQAQGDDEQRMLLALRAVVETPLSLPVRIGVHQGHVFAGEVGPPYRRTYTVMGDAVNLTARLMGRATPGQIMATGGVLDGAQIAFATAPLEPMHVKGKAEPVTAHIVGARIGAREAAPIAELPLVGRGEELDALDDALRSLAEGAGRLIEIVGPAGIGKTRLLGELRARGAGLPSYSAACDLYASSTPYHPFRRLIGDVLEIPPGASDAAASATLRARIASEAPELEPWLPLLGLTLDLELPPTSEFEQLSEQFRKERLEEAVAELLGRLLPGPALITIEDAHWMDDASADLLTRLLRELESRAWLVCVTRRDEETGFVAPAGPPAVQVRPSPLDTFAAEVLLVAASDDLALRPDEIGSLARSGSGNPLFLLELVRAVRDTGSLTGLPTSVEAIVAAQIDRLTPADRRVLRRASVLGVTFADELLGALFDEDEPLEGGVWERLAEFITEERPAERRFRHAVMRDAAYEGLPFRRRRELHTRVGEAIERRAGDAVADYAEVLSLHFLEAGRYAAAWRYSLTAGERARTKYANAEAADFFRRALEASRKAGDVPAVEIAGTWEALGEVSEKIGALEEAARALREARQRLRGNALAEARLLRREAEIAERSGRYVQELRLLGRGLKSLDSLDGPAAARERAQLSVWYASGRFRQGRHRDAMRWCEKAIGEAEAAGDREALAWAYLVLDMVHIELGTSTADPYGQLALSIYEQLGNLPRQASLTLNLGGRAYYEGRWDDAIGLYERARELYARTGDTVACADATFNIGEIRSQQGRLEEAEALLHDARRMWRASGDRVGVAYATSELGRVAYRSGRTGQALELLDQAAAAFGESGADAEALETDARRAECLLYAGKPAAARELVDTVRKRAQASGEVASIRAPRLLRLRGWALAQLGDLEGARAAYEESVALGRSGTADLDVALALEQLAALRQLEGEPEVTALTAESAAILELLGVERPPAASTL